MTPVRVLPVDDQELIRAGLRGILRPWSGFEVVGEPPDGAASSTRSRGPSPTSSSWTCGCRASTGSPRPARCAAWPAHPRCSCSRRSRRTTCSPEHSGPAPPGSGSRACPLRTCSGGADGRRGRCVAGPTVTGRVLSAFRDGPRQPAPDPVLNVLTARELEVLALSGAGRSNGEIAAGRPVRTYEIRWPMQRQPSAASVYSTWLCRMQTSCMPCASGGASASSTA